MQNGDIVKDENQEIEVQAVNQQNYEFDIPTNPQKELTRMDIWERKLLDFSLRNAMLNLYLRQKAIQFISFDIDKIEDSLQEGAEYCITEQPATNIKINTEERLVDSLQMEPMREQILKDIKDKQLHTYHTETETKNVLKNIYRAARNAIEETGANSLFLAIGVLRWYENDQTDTARFAPLLMLPVEMVYKRGNYFIRTREEDIILNVTLTEFIRQNFDITIPQLAALPKDEHGVDVAKIFAIIREATKGMKRWEVKEECILGVFSFSKFLMWNDIHTHRDELLKSDVVRSLVEQRLAWQPAAVSSNLKDKDKAIKPQELALPVAADSSQMAAVYEAGKGHSFILYGPPGTGKSQTITNLIANALFQGKRVLFVAEKMAALSVVQKRLAKIGLDPFCLEMHSNKIAKRHVLDQLAKALAVSHIVSPEEYENIATKLYDQRLKLINYMEALHEKGGTDGFSLFDCIVRYESIDAEPLAGFNTNETMLKCINAKSLSDIQEMLGGRLEAVVKIIGQPSQHPLLGLHIDGNALNNESAIASDIVKAINILSKGISEYGTMADAISLRETLLRDNKESLLSTDSKSLYMQWRSAKAKWFIPRFFAKRSFKNAIKEHSPFIVEKDIDVLLDNLMSYQEKHKKIQTIQDVLYHYFGTAYETDELPDTLVLEKSRECMTRWKDNLTSMRDWYHWSSFADELRAKGLYCIVNTIEDDVCNTANIGDAFFKSFFFDRAKAKISASDALRTFEGLLFDEQVAQYKRLTDEFQMLSQKELYARLARNIPRVTDNVDSSSEIGLLNRNISNGARGMSLRDLFDQIPDLIEKLCPCMLMSPMSVAQYIDLAQKKKFDLVIFDEASQMPTSEAVGAIARGNALIVVGDPKQMPPTNFFSSANVDDDEAVIDDMESILEDCRTLEIPSLQLNWHYRSRHESLIAFSNKEYYEGSLITFPSADDQKTKVSLVPVDGVYDKGGKRSNRAEAEAIVKEVARRLGDEELRKHSIGIIAFSVVQQNLIEDILQEMLEQDRNLHEIADAMYEPIFVKNLENVQGDERDVILFSIGYGPDKTGAVSMNFGPLNNSGGERRLNVAVSRARQEMIVFSTLKASQIDLRRTKSVGVEGLKHFLEYAEQQILSDTEQGKHERNESVVARQIADAIGQNGYIAKVNVGRSKFKIDVAISTPEEPDTYKLGILLDGEGYRDTQTTRDREIVQPSVLTGLSWQLMRVWSVDWVNNPDRVLSRILDILQNGSTPPEDPQPVMKFDLSNEKIDVAPTNLIEYEELQMTQKKAVASADPQLAMAIVHQEQPISFNHLCRRVCNLRGVARVTPTIHKTFLDIANTLFFVQSDRQGVVLWEDKASAQGYPSYRQANGRDIADIPMIEIKNAVKEAITEQFAISSESLSLITAKKLGFTRRTANIEAAFSEAVSLLVNEGCVAESNGKLSVKK